MLYFKKFQKKRNVYLNFGPFSYLPSAILAGEGTYKFMVNHCRCNLTNYTNAVTPTSVDVCLQRTPHIKLLFERLERLVRSAHGPDITAIIIIIGIHRSGLTMEYILRM